MSLRQAAQKGWKGTKRLQAKTMGKIQAKSAQMRQAISNSRSRISFVLKLVNWKSRNDTRGVAARVLLARMPSLLTSLTTTQEASRVRRDLINWSKYERTSTEEMKAVWTRTQRYLNQTRSSYNNEVTIFSDGSQAMEAMWASIQSAQKRVWMTTYILKPDTVGLKTIEELTAAARRGVQVIFIYDHFGSFGFSESHFAALRGAGGSVLCFNSITSFANFFRFDIRSAYVLNRNHRKLLVIDNAVGYCGGMNVAGDYCGERVGGNGRFRDTHSRIVGPGVVHLAQVFLSTLQTMQSQKVANWAEIMKRSLKMAEEMPAPGERTLQLEAPADQLAITLPTPRGILPKPISGSFLQVLASNTRENKRAIQTTLSETIDLSQKHIYLTSPYFLPPRSIRRAIIRAARRGVDVRILTAGKSDILFITSASAHIYDIFLRNGVRMYELQSQELHAKTLTSDGAIAMVGSYNLDNLSYKHNLEANLNFVDSKLAIQLERQFFQDIKGSKEVLRADYDNRPLIVKAWHWLVYSVFRLLLR